MKDKELKPCPFCGSKELYSPNETVVFCENEKCNAKLDFSCEDENARIVWNTRPAVGIGEKELLKVYEKSPNYDDELTDEMWQTIKKAVKYNDKNLLTQMMKISVNITRKECARATVERFGVPLDRTAVEWPEYKFSVARANGSRYASDYDAGFNDGVDASKSAYERALSGVPAKEEPERCEDEWHGKVRAKEKVYSRSCPSCGSYFNH